MDPTAHEPLGVCDGSSLICVCGGVTSVLMGGGQVQHALIPLSIAPPLQLAAPAKHSRCVSRRGDNNVSAPMTDPGKPLQFDPRPCDTSCPLVVAKQESSTLHRYLNENIYRQKAEPPSGFARFLQKILR
ncbi:hypothetical protein AMECASPLE_019167 [Ameca splendens]|uniref:Uncharacterized protein n=1 Tax=Ameca splendens TaxID=208324 RepID=A0ABV0ZCY9_9TELE